MKNLTQDYDAAAAYDPTMTSTPPAKTVIAL